MGRIRRDWPDDFKIEMAARSLMPGVNSSALAREIGISPAHLFSWRKFARDRGLLHKLDAEQVQPADLHAESAGSIELEIGDVVIRCPPGFDETALTRVVRAVRAA
jgi:transposase